MENNSQPEKHKPALNNNQNFSPRKNFYYRAASFLWGFTLGAVLLSLVWFYLPSLAPRKSAEINLAQVNNLMRDVPKTLEDISAEDEKELLAYLQFKYIKQSFIPTGVPEVYGEELNISFDRVQDAINKVRIFGPTYGQGSNKIVLAGDDLKRYIDIGFKIACEYCCNVKTLVNKDGSAACGCAHSIMMRGLTAYLIKNHSELTNEEILQELTKWKTTYFPKQTLSAQLFEMEKAGVEGIKELLETFPEFLPQMVGGC